MIKDGRMKTQTRRLRREKKTLEVMIDLYCRKKHGLGLKKCDLCRRLYEYAVKRVDKCRFGENKPVCAKCTVHCFKPEMRELAREVMRYAGPRMAYRHPLLALLHLRDARKKV